MKRIILLILISALPYQLSACGQEINRLSQERPYKLTIDHPKSAVPGRITSAFHPEADNKLILGKRAANDPKRTFARIELE